MRRRDLLIALVPSPCGWSASRRACALPMEADPVILKGVADDLVERVAEAGVTLVGAGTQLICAVSPPAVQAAINATREIPIVAVDLESDPVANGWARSLGRPGG